MNTSQKQEPSPELVPLEITVNRLGDHINYLRSARDFSEYLIALLRDDFTATPANRAVAEQEVNGINVLLDILQGRLEYEVKVLWENLARIEALIKNISSKK
jgi:hypothetical protein